MTSTVKITDIIHTVVKSPSDIAKSRLKEGRLPAGPVLNRIQPGQTIDIILMKTPLLIDTTIELNEIELNEKDIRKKNHVQIFRHLNKLFPESASAGWD